MSCFVLFCIYWVILILEQLFIHGPYVKSVFQTKKAPPFILDDKREKWLYILLITRALIMVLQLILGPLVDSLSFWFTALAMVLGGELFGLGFGALITMNSILALVNTKRKNQDGSQESDAASIDVKNCNATTRNARLYQTRMAVLIPIAILIGVVIGVVFYTMR